MNVLALDHVFITRFNVPTPGREGFIRAQDGWLKNRVELFEEYCLPAVEAQTLQEFHWLIYFDPESPRWLMDWLEQEKLQHRFRAVFRSSVSREELISDLRELTGAQGKVLLTTNLDNDDGLAVDFVQRLQKSVSSPRRTAVYLEQGLILSATSTYLRSDPHNAFCSVSESWDEPVTAWADWHNRLGLSMPIQQISGPPAWLQIIHARNVSNAVHGRLCNPGTFAHLFPYALDGMKQPSQNQLLIDLMITGPVRYLRGRFRLLIKEFILKHFGKDRFNFFKDYATSLNYRVGSALRRRINPTWSQGSRNRGNNREINGNT